MKLKPILILCGWTILMSSIILQALYTGPVLSWPYWLLLLFTSVLSGILLVDLKAIVIGYFIVVALSIFLTIFFLAILPVVTGRV